MTSSPVITSILALPGLSTTSAEANRPATLSTRAIHIGLVLDAKQVAWGVCPGGTISGDSAGLALKESLAAIREIITPAFEGKRLARFPEMASRLEELEAPATFTRPLPEVKSAGQVSRRDVLTGRLGKRDAKPRTETITVDKPLNSAIRFGVSEALLRALAMAQGETITEVLVREYGLPLSRRVIPIHTEVKGGQAMPLYPQLASLEFRLPGVDPEKELGENDERLQRLTRQLSERIAEATSGTRPTLHLNVNGGLGRLYQNNNGKILGALYGLQRVAAPLTLRIEDPVLDDDFQARSRMLAEIRDLLRMRSMSLQLVAGAGISELGDVETLLNANAAHMIRLPMVRLGTIHETMTAIIACQDQGIGVLLSGAPAEVLGNVALATQPELAAAPDDAAGLEALYGAMARTATWLSRKPGNGEGSLP